MLTSKIGRNEFSVSNDKIFETLEFEKIRQAVRNYAQTELANQLINQMTPSDDIEVVQNWQDETEESLSILNQDRIIPVSTLKSLTQAIQRLRVGASLNGQEIARIGRLLKSVKEVTNFFERLAEDDDKQYPSLQYWVDQCIHLPEVEKLIHKSIDEDGSVLSSASAQLASIRRNQSNTEQQIRNQLNQILKSKASQLTDSLITIRNERYVVPVKAEYRYQMGGTVHDQSSTGQTLYIEPQSVVNLNNKLSELKVAERKEIERILVEISQELMPHVDEITINQEILAQIDFIQSRGRYAKETNSTKPILSDDLIVALWQARHPLISSEDIVANDILLGEEYKALIITGPNTGGKTILLKTLGLLHLMGQSGLHIPTEEGSQIGIFDNVFADIGDEQSIEQSLSTFSSHMTNNVRIINHATYRSLVLFDELGSGTDPQEGAALAVAILEHFRKIDATVMATTHYPELKLYANNTKGTINASMEFNSDTLSPTYRLLIGVPGRSNALEISQRLGLDDSIIQTAKEGISRDEHSINEMVANLEHERRAAEQSHLKAQRFLDDAQQLHQDLRQEYNRWLEQKSKIQEKAKEEANELLRKKQDEAEKILSEIRELQLEQGQNTTIKEHVLIDKKSSLEELKVPVELRKNKVLTRAKQQKSLKVGDDVEVTSYGQRGTIVEKASSNEYIVQMGILKMKINEKDLEPLKKVKETKSLNIQRSAGSKVQTTLDIRGERYDSALTRLQQYLDQALLSNHPMVTIVHGKGTGALRSGVQQALSKHPQVDRFEYSPPNAGGDGSTIVYFK
ncbi:endonuclease MutS2 [Aerococcaceae bacterium WGS1372]